MRNFVCRVSLLALTIFVSSCYLTKAFDNEYDYIVVGAGSAGSVIAARLSEDACMTVLLLEAGGPANPLSEIPAAAFLTQKTYMDWDYKTVPQKRGALKIANRQLPLPRGKAFGGTSLLNFVMYVRGNKLDYDRWEEKGATGWDWKDVLPYFLKSENQTDSEILRQAPGYHNTSGPLTVSSARYCSNLMSAFSNSAEERGYEYRDINSEKQTGFYKLQGTVRDALRCSTAKAFLDPASDRSNLHIVGCALVTKILINDKKEAYGVTFDINNNVSTVYARKEIIVSGGTINSPQLLMLSGIGPKKHLEKLKIPVIADLHVGDNLQDHVGTTALNFEASKTEPLLASAVLNPVNYLEFLTNRTGPLTSFSAVEGMAFIHTKYSNRNMDWPDAEIHLAAASAASDFGIFLKDKIGITEEVYNQVYAPYAGKKTFTFFPCNLRPLSRGTIRLKSKDPKEYPLIDHNLFQFKNDLDILVEVMKECVAIVNDTKAFKNIDAKMFQTKFPGCEGHTLYSDGYLRCVGRRYTFTLYHPVGTCKMGAISDKTAVVDPQLRVIGIKKLRVADGSIMPYIVSGNTNAPIIMIAEKVSDMIKADNPDRRKCKI